MKNSRSQIAVAVSAVSAQRRWCLSGTPLQNNGTTSSATSDSFDTIRTARPGVPRMAERFRVDPATGFRRLQAICGGDAPPTKRSRIRGTHRPSASAHGGALSPRLFTRRGAGVRATSGGIPRQDGGVRGGGDGSSNYVNLLHMLLRMRQACNHPSMVGGRPAGWEDCPEATAGAVAEIIAASEKVTGATTAARRLGRAAGRCAAAERRPRLRICGDPRKTPPSRRAAPKSSAATASRPSSPSRRARRWAWTGPVPGVRHRAYPGAHSLRGGARRRREVERRRRGPTTTGGGAERERTGRASGAARARDRTRTLPR